MNLEKSKFRDFCRSIIFLISIFICACTQEIGQHTNSLTENKQSAELRAVELVKYREEIVPFFERMEIREGDWLETFQEDGQTFEEYISQNPTLPTEERKIIYIQPIGEFTETQKRILQLTAEYMQAFYGLPVNLFETKSLGKIPKDFERKNPYEGQRQVKTGYFLDKILPEILPKDGAALICFTNVDLFPDETFNYLFGQANLETRVGVYSLWRFGNPDKSAEDFDLFLKRTLKIGVHETGHMFSIGHCKKYECLMSGTNHLEETDRRPLDVCPECMLKIAWAMKYEPVQRYENLARFCEKRVWNETRKTFLEKSEAIKRVAR